MVGGMGRSAPAYGWSVVGRHWLGMGPGELRS